MSELKHTKKKLQMKYNVLDIPNTPKEDRKAPGLTKKLAKFLAGGTNYILQL